MADPVLDEEGILELLSVPVTVSTVSALQAAAVQAMIDLYDRKVTREEFIKDVAPCIELYGQTSKLWLLANVEQVYLSGDLSPDRFKKAHEGLIEIITRHAGMVTDIVKRLTQCPTSKDPIN